jgi:hypothetical protein
VISEIAIKNFGYINGQIGKKQKNSDKDEFSKKNWTYQKKNSDKPVPIKTLKNIKNGKVKKNLQFCRYTEGRNIFFC